MDTVIQLTVLQAIGAVGLAYVAAALGTNAIEWARTQWRRYHGRLYEGQAVTHPDHGDAVIDDIDTATPYTPYVRLALVDNLVWVPADQITPAPADTAERA